MFYSPPFRFRFVVFLVAVMAFSTLLATSASAQRGRRFVRQRSPSSTPAAPTPQKTPERAMKRESGPTRPSVTPSISPDVAATQLAELCAVLKNEFKPLTEADVQRSKSDLRKAPPLTKAP